VRIGLGLRDWGAAELVAGLRGALGLVRRERAEGRLANWFRQAFARPAFVVNSGSTALRLALECLAAEQPSRHEVVVPALACPAITRAVRASGLCAVYADVADDLNTPVDCVRDCLTPSTLAVVMVHAYGHAADSAGLSTLCKDAGIGLIDDAAQRIDPSSGLGRAGDFGIFSFAQSKSVVTGIDGSGGVLLVNQQRHLAALNQRITALPVARGRTSAWLEFLATGRAPRLAYAVARWRRRGVSASGATPARIGALDAAIAEKQLQSLAMRLQRRRKQLLWYSAALLNAGFVAPQLKGTTQADYLARLLIRLPPDRRDECRAALAYAGFASRLPYRLAEGLHARDHPRAAHDARALLELPLPAGLVAQDVVRLARILAPYGTPNQDSPGAPA
jgi:perosamine synthetase